MTDPGQEPAEGRTVPGLASDLARRTAAVAVGAIVDTLSGHDYAGDGVGGTITL